MFSGSMMCVCKSGMVAAIIWNMGGYLRRSSSSRSCRCSEVEDDKHTFSFPCDRSRVYDLLRSNKGGVRFVNGVIR